MNDPIFNPIKCNALEVKNRIYMPAMHLGMGSDYHVTDQLVDFYAERAKGGAGAISMGFATVNELAGGSLDLEALGDSPPDAEGVFLFLTERISSS